MDYSQDKSILVAVIYHDACHEDVGRRNILPDNGQVKCYLNMRCLCSEKALASNVFCGIITFATTSVMIVLFLYCKEFVLLYEIQTLLVFDLFEY